MQLDELSVYVKSIGFMGDYRFSKQTGLWYTGSHEVHLMGNEPLRSTLKNPTDFNVCSRL